MVQEKPTHDCSSRVPKDSEAVLSLNEMIMLDTASTPRLIVSTFTHSNWWYILMRVQSIVMFKLQLEDFQSWWDCWVICTKIRHLNDLYYIIVLRSLAPTRGIE